VNPDALDEDLRGHVRRAHALVARRLSDARSHAAVGAIEAAASRVDELGQGLAIALAEARGEFYRRAFRKRDPSIHDMDQPATRDGEHWARTTEIAGRNQYDELARPLAEAIVHLKSAAGQEPRDVMLAGWEALRRRRLSRHIEAALSDAQMAIHHCVGIALTREDIR
jgi:hypothetical protein